MISLVISAFLLGIAGSIHCLGMCGPIAISLPMQDQSRLLSTFLYNSGRSITYALLGIIIGFAGSFLRVFAVQQWISIGAGMIILILLVSGKFISLGGKGLIARQMSRVRQSLAKLFTKAGYRSVFSIGLLNGLLPCGLVYIALAGAISAGSVAKSSLFMLMFGLGTIPAMWTLSFVGTRINYQVRNKIKKAYPIIIAVMACLLIIRGLGLGIPYLSPGMQVAGEQLECHD